MKLVYPFVPPGYEIEKEKSTYHYGDIDIYKLPKEGYPSNYLVAWVSKRNPQEERNPNGKFYAIQRSIRTQQFIFEQEVDTQQAGLDLLAARICLGMLEAE